MATVAHEATPADVARWTPFAPNHQTVRFDTNRYRLGDKTAPNTATAGTAVARSPASPLPVVDVRSPESETRSGRSIEEATPRHANLGFEPGSTVQPQFSTGTFVTSSAPSFDPASSFAPAAAATSASFETAPPPATEGNRGAPDGETAASPRRASATSPMRTDKPTAPATVVAVASSPDELSAATWSVFTRANCFNGFPWPKEQHRTAIIDVACRAVVFRRPIAYEVIQSEASNKAVWSAVFNPKLDFHRYFLKAIGDLNDDIDSFCSTVFEEAPRDKASPAPAVIAADGWAQGMATKYNLYKAGGPTLKFPTVMGPLFADIDFLMEAAAVHMGFALLYAFHGASNVAAFSPRTGVAATSGVGVTSATSVAQGLLQKFRDYIREPNEGHLVGSSHAKNTGRDLMTTSFPLPSAAPSWLEFVQRCLVRAATHGRTRDQKTMQLLTKLMFPWPFFSLRSMPSPAVVADEWATALQALNDLAAATANTTNAAFRGVTLWLDPNVSRPDNESLQEEIRAAGIPLVSYERDAEVVDTLRRFARQQPRRGATASAPPSSPPTVVDALLSVAPLLPHTGAVRIMTNSGRRVLAPPSSTASAQAAAAPPEETLTTPRLVDELRFNNWWNGLALIYCHADSADRVDTDIREHGAKGMWVTADPRVAKDFATFRADFDFPSRDYMFPQFDFLREQKQQLLDDKFVVKTEHVVADALSSSCRQEASMSASMLPQLYPSTSFNQPASADPATATITTASFDVQTPFPVPTQPTTIGGANNDVDGAALPADGSSPAALPPLESISSASAAEPRDSAAGGPLMSASAAMSPMKKPSSSLPEVITIEAKVPRSLDKSHSAFVVQTAVIVAEQMLCRGVEGRTVLAKQQLPPRGSHHAGPRQPPAHRDSHRATEPSKLSEAEQVRLKHQHILYCAAAAPRLDRIVITDYEQQRKDFYLLLDRVEAHLSGPAGRASSPTAPLLSLAQPSIAEYPLSRPALVFWAEWLHTSRDPDMRTLHTIRSQGFAGWMASTAARELRFSTMPPFGREVAHNWSDVVLVVAWVMPAGAAYTVHDPLSYVDAAGRVTGWYDTLTVSQAQFAVPLMELHFA